MIVGLLTIKNIVYFAYYLYLNRTAITTRQAFMRNFEQLYDFFDIECQRSTKNIIINLDETVDFISTLCTEFLNTKFLKSANE